MKSGLLREGVIYGLGGALARFTGVFVTPIYTRFLTTEEFGLLDFGTTSMAILMLLTELQLNSGYLRHYLDYKKDNWLPQLKGALILAFLVLSAIVGLGLFLYTGTFGNDVFELDWSYFQPITLILFPNLLIQMFLSQLRMEHKTKTFIIFSVGQTWLTATLGVLGVYFIDASALTILWSIFITQVLFVVPVLLILGKQGISFSKLSIIGPLLKYSVPIVPNVLSNWLNRYISRFFILSMLAASALGLYGLSTKISALFLILITGFRMAWYPYAMSLFQKKNTEGEFVKVYYLYFLFGFVALAGLSTLSWPLVSVFGGVDYYGAIVLVPFILGGLFWDGALNVLAIGNNWTKKTYANILGSVLASGANFIILWFFTKELGLPLVAFTFMVCSQIQSYVVFLTAQRNKRLPYNNGQVLLTFLLTDVYVLLVFYFNDRFNSSSWSALGLIAITSIMFVLLIYRYLIPSESKSLLLSLSLKLARKSK